MFCLRSWLPLLFIPTNASPAFILLFFISTYFLNRPCIYCSILLLILFISSCHWSDHCFFDIHSNWFEPRFLSSPFPNPITEMADRWSATANSTAAAQPSGDTSILVAALNQTAAALAGAALEAVKRRGADARPAWTGIGVEWIRSLLGRREWRVPCLGVLVRL